VVKVSGGDARDFLNGLVTTDVTLLRQAWPVRGLADPPGQNNGGFS